MCFDHEIQTCALGFEAMQSSAVCACSELAGPIQTHHPNRCPSHLHAMFFVHRKHIRACKRSALNETESDQTIGSSPRRWIHPARLRIGVFRAADKTLNRKMSFTSHTACACAAVKYLRISIAPHPRLFSASTYVRHTLRQQEKYLSVRFSVCLRD